MGRFRHKGRDGLTSMILPFALSKDEDGEYMPYCDYHRHRGIVLKPRTCEIRQCRHYLKIYKDGVGRLDDATYDGDCKDL